MLREVCDESSDSEYIEAHQAADAVEADAADAEAESAGV